MQAIDNEGLGRPTDTREMNTPPVAAASVDTRETPLQLPDMSREHEAPNTRQM